MSTMNFVGGEKGGVGKSVVARLIAQYWIDRGFAWRGFDTDRSRGSLLRYYADYSAPLNVHDVNQLDQLVEIAISDDMRLLIDLAAQTEGEIYQWIDNGGVIDLAAEFGFSLRFWHVMDDGKDAVELLARMLDHYNDNAQFVVVLNQGRGSDFSLFRESEAAARVQRAGIPVIELRALHRQTMLNLDRHDKSFWAAVNHAGDQAPLGIMERQRMRVWLRSAFTDFEHLNV